MYQMILCVLTLFSFHLPFTQRILQELHVSAESRVLIAGSSEVVLEDEERDLFALPEVRKQVSSEHLVDARGNELAMTGEFDAVILIGCHEWVEAQGLSKTPLFPLTALRHLKPGGRGVMIIPFGHLAGGILPEPLKRLEFQLLVLPEPLKWLEFQSYCDELTRLGMIVEHPTLKKTRRSFQTTEMFKQWVSETIFPQTNLFPSMQEQFVQSFLEYIGCKEDFCTYLDVQCVIMFEKPL